MNSDVRLAQRIEGVAVVAVYRTGIDAVIDRKKRHASIAGVVRSERPETTVRVAVLRTNARVQHERPESRRQVDRAFKQPFAARNGKVRRDSL